MLLSTVGAPELAAIADEEVVPLAAGMAYALRNEDPSSLPARIVDMARSLELAVDKREALCILLAAGLAAIAAIPGETHLFQAPVDTRPVRLPEDEFQAFRHGLLRHAVFQQETYPAPRRGHVVRLIEKNAAGLTGRDAFAEVLYVSTGASSNGKSYYVVSLRPWRGAGTDAAAQAVLAGRVDIIEQVIAAVQKLQTSYRIDDREGRVLVAIEGAMKRLLDLCGPPVLPQTGQTSMRSSSSPSGQDGKVMGPPGNVSTIQMR